MMISQNFNALYSNNLILHINRIGLALIGWDFRSATIECCHAVSLTFFLSCLVFFFPFKFLWWLVQLQPFLNSLLNKSLWDDHRMFITANELIVHQKIYTYKKMTNSLINFVEVLFWKFIFECCHLIFLFFFSLFR